MRAPLVLMAYVKKTLAPGEEYIYRAHFNWTYDLESWFWLAFGLIPSAIWIHALVRNYLYTSGLTNAFFGLCILSILLAAIIALQRYIHKWTTVIAVTTARLILKTGLIARDTHEVTLDKIEEVLVHQSFLDRIVGRGTLTIRGTGIALIEFPVLARPTQIRRKIEEAVVSARGLGQQRAATPQNAA